MPSRPIPIALHSTSKLISNTMDLTDVIMQPLTESQVKLKSYINAYRNN